MTVVALNAWAQTSTPPVLPKVEPEPDRLVLLASRRIRAHDPSTIVKCGDEYWLFATGNGIVSWRSKDLLTWGAGPQVFTNPPAWTTNAVPGNRGYFWAPDVIHVRNQYLLYFSVSTWGKNTSAIGLATNPTLDPAATNYAWIDAGPVIRSKAEDQFNAIDPAVTVDRGGYLWLAFGSFWSGIRMIQLDPKTGKRLAPDSPIYSLAHYDSIETSYLYQHDGYYYLFVNWGMCCRGANSTYSIHVGRSKKVTGPYLDRKGKDMLYGGGTLLLDTTEPYFGPGHSGIIVDNGTTWFSCHYEASPDSSIPGQRRGSRLAVMPLRWTVDDWPQLDLK